MNAQAEKRAFVDRIDRHRAILFKVAAAYCRNQSDREDLVQEMMAHLWSSYGQFEQRSSFETWMYRVAMNVAIAFLRSETRKRCNLVPADSSILEAIPNAGEPEPDERLSVLHGLIDELASLDRALMFLYLDDHPYSEIAAILGTSETNVGTKIARIKERLKTKVAARALEQNGDFDGTR